MNSFRNDIAGAGSATLFARRLRSRQGFTLVELTLSISIIVVLGAIAMPRYSRALANYRVRVAAQRVAFDLAQAQSYARSTSSSQTISFSAGSASYQITNLRDYDSPTTTYRVKLNADPYNSSITTLSFGSGAAQIVFDGYGSPDSGGSITLQSGDSTRSVIVDATTGKVSVR